jgi:ATP-binding protein involved in chromosome partitioning
MLIDLPGTGDIHLSIMQSLRLQGVGNTPQAVALADKKEVNVLE